MTKTKKNPQADNLGDPKASVCDAEATPIVAETSHGIDATAYVAGVYVAVIQIRHDGPEPRYRRRVVFNLPAANRAVDRAHMDGKEAHIVLCKLIPVGGESE